ncbi:hypothetical protein IQ254_10040 [Nodosilinea sp. LEGE 07088]|uniref:hypothetical protein n=1 Tax=Nodosilinea sp. LEGE 07088 TaxID=2777968 RepID=UPI00187E3DC2|nr:hypothetical protein [Nodosilinea sp. LEGE 07088]MBE9137547.1 hypothetical protein [Nodosilinea sp. LEGE 07088]
MRTQDAVWQGCFGHWQPLFIREYWLPLGHGAWQGFLTQGRGAVVCKVSGVTSAVDWGFDLVPYTTHFVAQAVLLNFCHTLGLDPDHWAALEAAVANYDPAQDVILLLLGDATPYITHLQGWAVPPPECSRQLGDRQVEFDLTPKP